MERRREVNRKVFLFSFLLLLVFSLSIFYGCGKDINKLPTLGNPSEKAKLADPPSLSVSPARLSGKRIKIVLTYQREKNADKEFYRLLWMTSGTARFNVEVKRGTYDDFVQTMQIGNEYLIYGRFEYDLESQRNNIYVD